MKAREWYRGIPQNNKNTYEFTYDELCNLLDEFAQMKARLQQPVVGGPASASVSEGEQLRQRSVGQSGSGGSS